jgi:uncharacterized membrane protein YkvA (DUF1232 family)
MAPDGGSGTAAHLQPLLEPPAAADRPPRRVSFAPSPRNGAAAASPSASPGLASEASSGGGDGTTSAPGPSNQARTAPSSCPATPSACLAALEAAAKRLKHEVLAIYYAAHDPRTPWYARLLPAVAVAYALSPLDLIPDFIPVLGLLDDVIILPALLWLALHAIPRQVLDDARARARREPLLLHRNWPAAVVMFSIWLASAELCVAWLIGKYGHQELREDSWAVMAGVAGLGCVVFSAWAVGRLRYDRRRRDAWNLSHQQQQRQRQRQRAAAAAGGAAAEEAAPGLAVVDVPEEQDEEEEEEEARAAAAVTADDGDDDDQGGGVSGGGGWGADAAAAREGDLEEGAGLPPALGPPPALAPANGVFVSHRRASGDDSSADGDEEEAGDNAEAAAARGHEALLLPPMPAAATAAVAAAAAASNKKRRSKPVPPPLPGSDDGDEDQRRPELLGSGHRGLSDDGGPTLVPAAPRVRL